MGCARAKMGRAQPRMDGGKASQAKAGIPKLIMDRLRAVSDSDEIYKIPYN
jgi:hypothetical protein